MTRTLCTRFALGLALFAPSALIGCGEEAPKPADPTPAPGASAPAAPDAAKPAPEAAPK